MTPLSAHLAVLTFPFLVLVAAEPIAATWAYKHGRRGVRPPPPLPPELKQRSDRNGRYVGIFRDGLLCTSVYLLMRKYSVSAPAVGLYFHHWPHFLLAGTTTGIALLIYQGFLSRIAGTFARRPVPYQPEDYLTGGSPVLWVFINIVGCFAEEYWRAFCLVSLERVGHGHLFAVLETSIVFGLAHHRGGRPKAFELGYFSAIAALGASFAVLFLWLHSIVATYTGHLLVNLVALYRARRSRLNKLMAGATMGLEADARVDGSVPGGGGIVACPVCGWKIRREELKRGTFPCPRCKEVLQWRSLRGAGLLMLTIVGGVSAFLIPYWGGVRGNALLVTWLLLLIPTSLGYAAVAGLFVHSFFPKLERAEVDSTSTHILFPPGSSSSSGSPDPPPEN